MWDLSPFSSCTSLAPLNQQGLSTSCIALKLLGENCKGYKGRGDSRQGNLKLRGRNKLNVFVFLTVIHGTWHRPTALRNAGMCCDVSVHLWKARSHDTIPSLIPTEAQRKSTTNFLIVCQNLCFDQLLALWFFLFQTIARFCRTGIDLFVTTSRSIRNWL